MSRTIWNVARLTQNSPGFFCIHQGLLFPPTCICFLVCWLFQHKLRPSAPQPFPYVSLPCFSSARQHTAPHSSGFSWRWSGSHVIRPSSLSCPDDSLGGRFPSGPYPVWGLLVSFVSTDGTPPGSLFPRRRWDNGFPSCPGVDVLGQPHT